MKFDRDSFKEILDTLLRNKSRTLLPACRHWSTKR